MFVRLSPEQIKRKLDFIKQYMKVQNPSDATMLDPNANVTSRNLTTLDVELNKDINIQVNRALMCDSISKIFGKELAFEYIRQIESHEIYIHDETSLKPYCVSISMYPFLLNGLVTLGGESFAPKHLESFCGSFVNLIFAISSQFAGAVATAEFLICFDHFARKAYGADYLTTHGHTIDNHLQHVIYAINQPAAARGYQCAFWNISIYDEYYFKALFNDFVFPDDDCKPEYQDLAKLQDHFMKWFNTERLKCVLTFPVITAAMLTENGVPKDKTFADTRAQDLSDGNSFFMYMSPSADSLSSCCRLRSEVVDNTFSYTLGAGGVATGSINVITLNMNRLVQDGRSLDTEIRKVQKYQVAYRKLIEQYLEAGMLSVYSAGYISLQKQFLTLGINGMVEAAEYLGICPTNNVEYKAFLQKTLKVFFDMNKVAKAKYGYMFNTEFVPAENLGVKNAKWDKKDGYKVKRDCYNSYFYPVEDTSMNFLDKFILHGEDIIQYLDGGSALHLNLEDYPSKETYLKLMGIAAKTGCNYWTTNIKITICNDCGVFDKRTLKVCVKCGSKNLDYGTRIIGYLKRVSAFAQERRAEEGVRSYGRL
jgi:anaerobic ribonucleoside-triphosphate reductase